MIRWRKKYDDSILIDYEGERRLMAGMDKDGRLISYLVERLITYLVFS